LNFEGHQWACTLNFNEACDTKFEFEYQGGPNKRRRELKVRVLELSRSLCRESLLTVYLSAVVGVIVGIGILTLLMWKLFMTYLDRQEYLKFEKEQAAAAWGTVSIVLLLYFSTSLIVSNNSFFK